MNPSLNYRSSSSRQLKKLEHFTLQNPSQQPRTRLALVDSFTRRQYAVSWICSLIAAGIMLETLFFKFTGSEESVYIFTKMGTEPWMRWVQGIWELLASIGLLWPRLRWAGGILTTGAMSAAILSHLTWLGFSVQNDHGLLFGMALVTFTCGFTVLVLHRRSIPFLAPLSNW